MFSLDRSASWAKICALGKRLASLTHVMPVRHPLAMVVMVWIVPGGRYTASPGNWIKQHPPSASGSKLPKVLELP
jgi:hypothetical protein